jgi:colanic acid/amylovoran biosynthesis protein
MTAPAETPSDQKASDPTPEAKSAPHRPKRVVLVGASITGNRGAESMLRAALAGIAELVDDAQFTLLSLFPEDDGRENDLTALSIVPFSPRSILTAALPAAAAYATARRLGRRPRVSLASLRAIAEADLVVDLSGISFVDGRGADILAYNVALILIPWLLGTPSVKFAQAMGPFRHPANRRCAKLCLPLVSRIGARGRITRGHLEQLGIDPSRIVDVADAAFAMQIQPAAHEAAARWLQHSAFEGDVVALSPSVVVDDYCRQRGVDYPRLVADFIRSLIDERELGVILLAHSARPGHTARKNNDLLVCREIKQHLGDEPRCLFPDQALHADALRVLIGRCRYLVASRFHAMVSGLAMGVPSLLVGWSHKYLEVLEQFELQDYALDYSNFGLDELRKQFVRLVDNEQLIRHKIAEHLPSVLEASRRNARLAADLLLGPS